MNPDAAASDLVLARAASGSRYTLLTQLARLVCKAVSVIVIARLVSPADHGLFAMATSLTMFLFLFLDLGLGTAIVQAPTLTAPQHTTLHYTYVALGVILALLTIAVAPLAARFYAHPGLIPLLTAISATFLLNAWGGMPRAILRRELNFRVLNWIETIAAATSTAAMLLSAGLGAGVYTFVVFLLVSEAVSSAAAWLWCGWRPAASNGFHPRRDVLQTGWQLTRYHLLNYSVQQVDLVLIGRFFGAPTLGAYSRAAQMLSLPLQHVAGPLSTLALSVLSRLQTDRPAFERQALSRANLIAHLTLPVAALAVAAPDEIVRAVLGEQWPAAAPMLRWLAISAAIAQVTQLGYAVCVASGAARRLTPMAVFALPIVFVAVWFGSQNGASGVAIALAAVNFALAIPRLAWSLHGTPVPTRKFLVALATPVVFAALLSAGAGVGRALAGDSQWMWRLAAAIGGSLAAGGLGLLASNHLRREWRAVWIELRGLRSASAR